MNLSTWVGLCSLALLGLGGCAHPPQPAGHAHAAHGHNHGDGHDEAKAAVAGPETISIDQVRQQLAQGTAIIFIDTRNDLAWSSSDSQIPGALRIGNNQQLAAAIKELPKDSFIVPYCT